MALQARVEALARELADAKASIDGAIDDARVTELETRLAEIKKTWAHLQDLVRA